MKITMQLIADRLSLRFPVSCYGTFTQDTLDWPEIGGATGTVPGKISILPAAELPDFPQFSSASLTICAGPCRNSRYLENAFPFLVVDATFPELFNEVLTLLRRVEGWEKSLTEALGHGADICTLLRLSLPVFENDINLVDWKWNMTLLGMQEKTALPDVSGQIISKPLKREDIQGIQDRIQKHGYDFSPRFCNDYFYKELYCLDLFSGGEHIGELGIIGTKRPLLPSDAQLEKTLAYYIGRTFQRRSAALEAHAGSRGHLLARLLDGNKVSQAEIKRVFSSPQQGNGQEDGRLLCMKLVGYGEATLPPMNLCAGLEAALPGCQVIEYGSALTGVMDFEAFPYRKENFIEVLLTRLIEFGLCAGISNAVDKPEELPTAYRQACAVLELSTQLGTKERISRFSKLALPYLLQSATGEFPVTCFCSPGLLQIWRKRNGTKSNDWTILCMYLEVNCNTSKAADLLYMHRTTLMKRLNRIQ